MKYVLGMTLGTSFILLGIVFLVFGAGTSISVFIIAIGAFFIWKSYNPWRSWYSKGKEDMKNEMEKIQDQRTVIKAEIIGTDSKMKTSSSLGRAMVGDFVAGPTGAIVGALTGKKKGYTKFLVEYKDGHKEVEETKDNSERFNELIEFCK